MPAITARLSKKDSFGNRDKPGRFGAGEGVAVLVCTEYKEVSNAGEEELNKASPEFTV